MVRLCDNALRRASYILLLTADFTDFAFDDFVNISYVPFDAGIIESLLGALGGESLLGGAARVPLGALGGCSPLTDFPEALEPPCLADFALDDFVLNTFEVFESGTVIVES